MFEFIGDAAKLTDNGHKGMARAFPGNYKVLEGADYKHAIFCAQDPEDRVVVIASGGGGSGPLVAGYVHADLADAGVTGDIHASPSAYAIYKAGLKLNRGHGILLVYNNFMGDCLNNDMAAELLEHEGIEVRCVEAHDNMASAPRSEKEQRSGLCGMLLLLKIAKACAQSGADLETVFRITEKANKRISSLSVTTNAAETAIEYGKGFSGEAALYATELAGPEEVARRAVDELAADLQLQGSEKLVVLINRLRMSSYFESFVMVDAVGNYLDHLKFTNRITAGSYLCINREHGFYFTMLAADEEIYKYLEHECKTDSFAV